MSNLLRQDANLHPLTARTCHRCGQEFKTSDRERVCGRCRKPQGLSREIGNRELTFRETQIVELVAKGKLNKEIAYELLLTEGTIKEYLNRIFRKTQATNRTELAVWAVTRTPAIHAEARAESDSRQPKRAFII